MAYSNCLHTIVYNKFYFGNITKLYKLNNLKIFKITEHNEQVDWNIYIYIYIRTQGHRFDFIGSQQDFS